MTAPFAIAAVVAALAALPAAAGGYGAPPPAMKTGLDALVRAYPDHLESHDGTHLLWKDGTRMAVSDGRTDKSFADLLDAPDIDDQFAFAYPAGAAAADPGPDVDPGRIRNEPFFLKMYGDCRRGEVKRRLRTILFFGKPMQVTTVNGVDRALEAVMRDLQPLPPALHAHLTPHAGAYNCRTIAGTRRLSVHAYGAAVDIATRSGDYWQWSKPGRDGKPVWRNRIPAAIVEAFERHGFIWGGRWSHFDTLHFEYRPELIGEGARPEGRADPTPEPAGAPPPPPHPHSFLPETPSSLPVRQETGGPP
ncbi:hypothetical protein J2847_003325 [Azospirillum agricola]|uniref:M15 family metallopeptidase n=1 Tax=Azospirillum agricola TaxID=1720247 RepID=UPI001AE48998|nr:M15 family metallopeptidase [Azospirillum agricola]MBP2230022.1 hypothetical protein [Azospirillum agricola]